MITKLIAALNTVNRAVGKNITYNGFGLREVKYPFRAWDAHKYKKKAK